MREACVLYHDKGEFESNRLFEPEGCFFYCMCVCVRERHDWRVMWGIADSVGRPEL